ncbi:LOW QUALITY PROTEIN: hypothetical protein HJC23_001880 [Cyclotella cryptica]|uniref:Uncharacterized protein n=1 Tax=Cyclotella cryptica TaxID=29204 RepID=A0ABD3PLL5_9STRA
MQSLSSSSTVDTSPSAASCCDTYGVTQCAANPSSDDRFGILRNRKSKQRLTLSSYRCPRKRRIHASSRTWIASTVTITTAAVVAAATFAVVSCPIPILPFCEAFSSPHVISASTSIRLSVNSLHAVRKRSGNHDVSAARIKNAVTSKSLTSTPSPQQKLEQHQQQRKQTLVQIQMTRQQQRPKRSRNVFEQFTPDYVKSPFDVDVLPKFPSSNNPETITVKVDDESVPDKSKEEKHLSKRLQSLLQNDEGEQDYFADDSPEAARQVADIRIYGKLSEEARRKATEAVKEVKDKRRKVGEARNDSKREQELMMSAAATSTRKKRTSTIRATVKETGSDSISTYIKSLGQHELLYKADEILLGRQVRLLMNLEESRKGLEENLLRPPTFAEWATATNHTVPSLKQQIRRSQRAKAALIEANLRLVITVARQAVKKSSSSSSIQFQDACQQGIIGLTRATEKFDPELGFRFSTYAIWWIQKEVAKNVSEQARTVRVPPSAIKKINDIRIQERVLMNALGRRPTDEEVAEKVGMSVKQLNFYKQSAKEVQSLDKKIDSRTGKGSAASGGDSNGQTMESFVRDTDHPSPSELIDQQMMKEDIRRLVKTLSPREQAVIRLRFGLDDGKPRSLGEIAEKFRVEKETIKKIEARALLKLRQPSRSQVVKCYVSEHT